MKNLLLISLVLLSVSYVNTKAELGIKIDKNDFTETNVYPIYRLPDKDITVEWSTPSPGGIKIIYGDKVVLKESKGVYIIQASDITSMPETFTIKLIVNSEDGEERKINIETFSNPRTVNLYGIQVGVMEKFIVTFPEKQWDSDLQIKNIEMDVPKSYYCGQPAHEVQTKWEYYKDRNTAGYLNWTNEYKSDRGLPAPAVGVWTFRLWNYPNENYCTDLQPVDLSPEIIFTICGKDNQ